MDENSLYLTLFCTEASLAVIARYLMNWFALKAPWDDEIGIIIALIGWPLIIPTFLFLVCLEQYERARHEGIKRSVVPSHWSSIRHLRTVGDRLQTMRT